MKLLLVTEYYPPHIGGVQRVFEAIALRMAAGGHEVAVVTSRIQEMPVHEITQKVLIHRVWVPRFLSRYFFTFLSLPTLWRLSKGVDLIQTTTLNAAFPAWLIGRLRRIPVVLMVHEVFGPRWKTAFGLSRVNAWLHRLLERAIFIFRFDHYVAVSESTARDLAPLVPAQKITVIHHGIDEVLFDPASFDRAARRAALGLGERFTYLFVGRPGISKGLQDLIRAIPLIREKLPESVPLFVLSKEPAGGYARALELIHRLDLRDHLKILHSVPLPELVATMVASDVVVIPSRAEGFGFVAAESCALGQPVVVSRAGSLPEVVSGKVAFSNPGDPASIAEGVIRAHQGDMENIPVKTFSWEAAVERYLMLYRSLI